MTWKVEFFRAAERELDRLDPQHARKLLIFLHERLARLEDPRSPGEALKGNHRMEKARRAGLEHIMGYRVNMEQHLRFLTTRKAYSAYVEYWNEKLKDLHDNTRY